jgi:hypothetical protein
MIGDKKSADENTKNRGTIWTYNLCFKTYQNKI